MTFFFLVLEHMTLICFLSCLIIEVKVRGRRSPNHRRQKLGDFRNKQTIMVFDLWSLNLQDRPILWFSSIFSHFNLLLISLEALISFAFSFLTKKETLQEIVYFFVCVYFF